MQGDKITEEYIDASGFEEVKRGDWKEKLEGFLDGKYFIPVLIILVSIIAFSLGRISGLQEKRALVRVISDNPLNPPYLKGEIGGKDISSVSNIQQTAAVGASNTSGESVVASKNGTKYHYPWCAGAKQISEKNKIIFNSIAEARAAGYTPATNCKGLK
jgi:hypothetical protein